MKAKANLFLFLLILVIFSLDDLFGQIPEGDQNWEIIFYDDFNSLDSSVWNTNPFPPIYWNDYDESPSSLAISNSELKISAVKNGSIIQTGALQTNNSFGYGYFEARIKNSVQGNTWNNAFWLARGFSNIPRGSDGIYSPYFHPCCSNCLPQDVWWDEIDIEILSGSNITSNIHRVSGDCINNYEPGIFEYPVSNSFVNDYHIFGIEYMPGNVKFYLDNYKWNERNCDLLPDSSLWIIFQLGFTSSTGNISNNILPGYLFVDWVKYYKLITNFCETDAYISSNSDLVNFQFGVRRNITIGNGLANINLLENSKLTFRASGELIIHGNFSVPIGAELNLIPTQCY